jgi:hypothetical protein
VWPDFTLKAGTVGPYATYLHTVSVDPFITPINSYQYSPFSGASAKEKAAQWLGQSGDIVLPGVRTLEFWDWPERIGIDNLKLITKKVPEPATLLLGGLRPPPPAAEGVAESVSPSARGRSRRWPPRAAGSAPRGAPRATARSPRSRPLDASRR